FRPPSTSPPWRKRTAKRTPADDRIHRVAERRPAPLRPLAGGFFRRGVTPRAVSRSSFSIARSPARRRGGFRRYVAALRSLAVCVAKVRGVRVGFHQLLGRFIEQGSGLTSAQRLSDERQRAA